jgi:membrane associated rhomboid family serine protease
MMALDDYGSLMEEVTGPGRLLAVYATSALAGVSFSHMQFTSFLCLEFFS